MVRNLRFCLFICLFISLYLFTSASWQRYRLWLRKPGKNSCCFRLQSKNRATAKKQLTRECTSGCNYHSQKGNTFMRQAAGTGDTMTTIFLHKVNFFLNRFCFSALKLQCCFAVEVVLPWQMALMCKCIAIQKLIRQAEKFWYGASCV